MRSQIPKFCLAGGRRITRGSREGWRCDIRYNTARTACKLVTEFDIDCRRLNIYFRRGLLHPTTKHLVVCNPNKSLSLLHASSSSLCSTIRRSRVPSHNNTSGGHYYHRTIAKTKQAPNIIIIIIILINTTHTTQIICQG